MTGGWEGATWKRVESEDELRAGMTVQVRPCTACHNVERRTLLGTCTSTGKMVRRGMETYPPISSVFWVNIGGCEESRRRLGIDAGRAIREGRIYRLVDTTPAE